MTTVRQVERYFPDIPDATLGALAAALICCNSICYLAFTVIKEFDGISVTDPAFFDIADDIMNDTQTKLSKTGYDTSAFSELREKRNMLAHSVQFNEGSIIVYYNPKDATKTKVEYSDSQFIEVCKEIRTRCLCEQEKLLSKKNDLQLGKIIKATTVHA